MHSVTLNPLCFFCLKICFAYTNSVDPDEMPQNAAFHQGLHCLHFNKVLIKSISQEKILAKQKKKKKIEQKTNFTQKTKDMLCLI